MPYVYKDRVRGEARDPRLTPSTRSEVLTETFATVFEENPIMAVRRYQELSEDQRTGPILPAENARARLRDAGMENDLVISDSGITEAALETLMERKRIELRRQEVAAQAQGGAVETASRLGIAIATTLVDPISMGLNFVPVVGQTRYARWLSQTRSLAGRIGVRARVGAIEGAAGAAIAEVPIHAMRTQEQADYDMGNSLLNVAFGGVIGSGLHTTVGSVAEMIGGLPESRIPRATDLAQADRILEQRLATRVARDVEGSIAEYAALDGADGGRILNTDLARELSPEYRLDRTRSAAVHEPASWLVKRMYERKLQEAPGAGQDDLVVFSAGGTGAGKSTGLQLDPSAARAQIIYDTNMNSLEGSITKIEQALAAGKLVNLTYTWRDPVDALVNGALPRAKRMGRTVPIHEHAKTHVGAAKVVKELAVRYANDPRVTMNIIDNSHGKGGARLGSVADVRDLDYNSVRENLISALEAERAAGRISEAVYRGTIGTSEVVPRARGVDRQDPESERAGGQVSAAEAVRSSSPEVQQAALRAAVGQAVEGQPIDVAPILGVDEAGIPNDIDFRAATDAAERALARDVDPTIEANLKAAREEATLAESDAKLLMKRLGLEYKDADIDAVDEMALKAERWARAAELATVCLVRGG